ncbi:MAG: hypothetical protein IJJ33_04645 [Victivallales bacterium]|nr:hypothetical protein [Victivallales bacterium]
MFDKDHAAKVMFGNGEAVANLINEAFFQGDAYFCPEQFHALPTEEFCLGTEGGKGGAKASVVRDALWRCDEGDAPHGYLLFGLEFQSRVDYFMPGRLFLEAALNINARRREIDMKKTQCGKRKYASSEEYLSRFGKEDKIVKPLSVVVHFGGNTWDGPKCLSDISHPLPSALAEYDYDMRMPVVDLDQIPIERVRGFEQNLKLVLLYAMGRKDSRQMRRILAEEPGFRRVPHHVVELIKALFQTNIQIPEDKEDIDMCLAEEQMIEEGKIEGLLEGAERYVQMCRNSNVSPQEILSVLKTVFLLSDQNAADLLRKA